SGAGMRPWIGCDPFAAANGPSCKATVRQVFLLSLSFRGTTYASTSRRASGMATDERLDELRLCWQELQQKGRSVSVAELCAGCPELADALQRKIETVLYWETFLGAETVAEPPRSTPPSWGKFAVVRQLGEGGQASTLLVFDPDLRRHVVLKLYHHARTPEQQEVVLREGQALARVRSPYVAQCYSAERQEGVPYLVVEYI